MSAWKDFKQTITTWQSGLVAILAFISLVTGALGQFTGLLSFIPAPYLTLTKVALLYIGLIVFVWLFTSPMLTKRNQQAGLQQTKKDPFTYSRSKRTWSWTIRLITIAGLLHFVNWGNNIKKNIALECRKKSTKTGILVSRFSQQKDDPFSFQLYNYLLANLKDSLLTVDPVDRYIYLTARAHYEDSLSPFLSCYKNGMLVFGSRNLNEKSFFCNVYTKDLQATGQMVTDMLQPPGIDLPINTQLDIVGKFILMQLYYNKGDMAKSMNYLDTLASEATVKSNNQLNSYCLLYKGLNQLQNNQYQESIRNFELAHTIDKNNLKTQEAINYMRTLKPFEANFLDSNILISKGFAVNDSIKYTFTTNTGKPIKDTVLPVSMKDKYIVLPNQSKWFTFYIGKDKVIQLDKGIKDSITAKKYVDSIKNMAAEAPPVNGIKREWLLTNKVRVRTS